MAYNIKNIAGNAAKAVGSAMFPKSAMAVNTFNAGRDIVNAIRNRKKTPASPFTTMSGAKPQAGQSYSLPQQAPTIGLSPSHVLPTQAVKNAGVPVTSFGVKNDSITPSRDVSWGTKKTVTPSLAGTPTAQPEMPPMPEFNEADFRSDDPAVQENIERMKKEAEASSGGAETDTTTTTPTYTPPKQNDVIAALRSKIGQLSGASAEERALADQLAQFRGQSAQAIAGLEGQGRGISLGLIRGQQGLLNTQSQLQEQTLMDRLATASAARQADLQAAQNEYQIAAAEQARQDQLTAPTTMGNQIVQFDPATGQYKTLYTAPETSTTSDKRYTIGDSLVDESGNVIYQAPQSAKEREEQALKAGNAAEASRGAQEKINEIEALKNHPGLNNAVGYQWLTQRASPLGLGGRNRADFIGRVTSLIDTKTIDNLIEAKSRGATFGALTDQELQILKTSASAINNWAVKDKNGKIIGFKIGEQEFTNAINKLQTDYQNALTKMQQTAVPQQNQQLTQEEQDYIRQKYNVEPSELFTNDLSTSQNGSSSMSANLGGLSEKYESGGNPGAIGYDSTGGYSYGTYQLAHNNAKNFVEQSPFKQAFAGLSFNSPQWRQRWQEVAKKAPQQFAQAQKAFIAKTHFEPQVNKLKQSGVNVAMLPQVIQDAIWSTAVQHGANTDVVAKAFSRLPKNATPADMLKSIYRERWSNGARFASSTPAVRQAVYNRFFGTNGELNTALRQLNQA